LLPGLLLLLGSPVLVGYAKPVPINFRPLRNPRTTCSATAGMEPQAFLYTFDLLELNGADLRREPIEVRKATLASILRKSRPGLRLKEHMEHPEGAVVFQHACKMGLKYFHLEVCAFHGGIA
jgi:ATP-dependent DNA ligase